MTAKDLKNALLQEAVQGRLVPQLASDGNAADLLKQIRAEKARLTKEGKIKKEKPLPEITADEIPFDIPESWCWCRLGEVCSVYGGKRIPAGRKLTKNDTGHKYIRVTDMKNDTVIDNDVHYITEDIYNQIKAYTISKNDVYITVAGTIGQAGTVPEFFDNANLTENANKLIVYNNYKNFIAAMLNSNYVQKQITDSTTKVGQPKLAIMRIQTLVIALPPLAEQKRIVAAIERFMPLIEEYGKKEEELRQLNASIGEQAKKALLQEAVQGRLVPQMASDGNARDLLKQIQAEKAQLIKEGKLKKEKPLPPITDDEIPFDIPENWCWCRFSDLFKILNGDRGKNYPAKSTLSKDGIPFISALNLKNNTVIKDDDLLCLSDIQYEKLGNGKLQKGDMVVCIRGSLGKHGVYPFDKGAIASSLVIVRLLLNNKILSDFLGVYLDSPLFFQEISNYDNGTAQPNLAAESFKQFLFPLPPIAEQKRIVSALEQLLPLCEKLGK